MPYGACCGKKPCVCILFCNIAVQMAIAPYYFEARSLRQGQTDPYSGFGHCIASAQQPQLIRSLREWRRQGNGMFLAGYLGYELQQECAGVSPHPEALFPIQPMCLFVPDTLHISDTVTPIRNEEDAGLEWLQKPLPDFSRSSYIQAVQAIKEHLQQGDIYELTFCIQLNGRCRINDPYALFNRLCRQNPGPFASLLHMNGLWVLSASPERFMAKRGQKLISQPIKGTIRRSSDPDADEALKKALAASEKDRSENVMIVDLVRNDLSRIALTDSVRVEELFGIHSFATVHQMISTISCETAPELHPADVMEAAFPPGSMTGAPKISAMNLIRRYEKKQRGIFSGSLGYVSPDGDMDWNVVIRSIIYDAHSGYISIPVGGAITIASDPAAEYEECRLKARASLHALGLDINDIKW